MANESKFIICPGCGALLEKGVQFCGYCGANVEKDKMETITKQEEPQSAGKIYGIPATPPQPGYKQPYGSEGLGKQDQSTSYQERGTWRADSQIGIRLNYARILAWMSICFSNFIIGIIFSIIAIVFALQARKLLGNDQRITQVLYMAVLGGVLSIAMTVYLVISIIRGGWFF